MKIASLLGVNINANDDQRIQSNELIETNPYRTIKNLVCKNKEIKGNNIIRKYKND